MRDDWDLTFSSEGDWAEHKIQNKTMPLKDWLQMAVEEGWLKTEDKYEEVYIKQDDGSFKKEVRDCIIYKTN